MRKKNRQRFRTKKRKQFEDDLLNRYKRKAFLLLRNDKFKEDLKEIRQLELESEGLIKETHLDTILRDYRPDWEKIPKELKQKKLAFYYKYEIDLYGRVSPRELIEIIDKGGDHSSMAEALAFLIGTNDVFIAQLRPRKYAANSHKVSADGKSISLGDVIDNGVVDKNGYIHIRVKQNSTIPKFLILNHIEGIIDSYVSNPTERFRKESVDAMEVWEARRLRKPFKDIASEFAITEDAAKKRYYRAFEIIHGKKYDPVNYEKPEIKKEYLKKVCETCEEREYCTDLCPDVLAYVIQDTKSYQLESTEEDLVELEEINEAKRRGRVLKKHIEY